MTLPQSIISMPRYTPTSIGKIANTFLITSNLRKTSERPFTFRIFKLIACNGQSILEKQTIPNDNKIDTDELPKEIVENMKFYFAKTYDDVKKIVFVEEDKKPKKTKVASKK